MQSASVRCTAADCMNTKYNPVRGCRISRRLMSGVRHGEQVFVPHSSTYRRLVKRETNRKIRRVPQTELPMASVGFWG